MCVYSAVALVICVTFNVALLRNVKPQRKSFSRHQILESRLTKTIVMIILLMIAAYLPLLVTVNIAVNISFTRKSGTEKQRMRS